MKVILFIASIVLGANSYGQDSLQVNADSLVEVAVSQLGVTYKYATSSPNVSFDCSGFTSYVYSSFEIPNSRSSKAYGNLGEPVSLENCKKGDCILFAGTQAGSTTIGHVGIVIQNNEDGLKFIHCSSSKRHYGVTITDYYESNYTKRFLQVRRLF